MFSICFLVSFCFIFMYPVPVISKSAPAEEIEDCDYLEWMSWTNCTARCSGGIKTRHRVLNMTSFHFNSNLTCEGAQTDIATCNEPPCPIDCIVSEWQAWSPCDCQQAQKHRRKALLQQAENDGALCSDSVEFSNCTCPLDCLVSDWSDWSMCGATCGHSVAWRNRRILVEPRNASTGCPPLNDSRICLFPPCPIPESLCYGVEDGDYADPDRLCSVRFISCTNEEAEWRKCPEDLIFDVELQRCKLFQNLQYCLEKESGLSADDWRFRWSSLLAMVTILLLMIAFLVRVVLWDVPCC